MCIVLEGKKHFVLWAECVKWLHALIEHLMLFYLASERWNGVNMGDFNVCRAERASSEGCGAAAMRALCSVLEEQGGRHG